VVSQEGPHHGFFAMTTFAIAAVIAPAVAGAQGWYLMAPLSNVRCPGVAVAADALV